LHNRLTSRFIKEWLDAQGWTESKLARESGVSRSVISDQLWSGKRRIRLAHFRSYWSLMNHQDRPKLLVLWLRDNIDQELLKDVLDTTGEDLSQHVKEFVPALGDEDKRMLAWLAREMARDGELADLFHLLSARAGYRPKRTAAGPVKRRGRSRGRGSGTASLLCFALAFALAFTPAQGSHARKLRGAAFNLRGRECFLLPAAEAA
jgi:hypothetical protein